MQVPLTVGHFSDRAAHVYPDRPALTWTDSLLVQRRTQHRASHADDRKEIVLLRPFSSISILSSRASQPTACMITSRGASIDLDSLATESGPSV